MSGSTTNYQLIKPTVGGSENEWGGNLNENFDKIDALLGPDEDHVIDGIIIEGGQIDGGAISGEIGGTDPDNPVSIHESTRISGKVDLLVGLDPDAEIPDRGLGEIRDCFIEARDLKVNGYIEEAQFNQSTTGASFNPDKGTLQYIFMPSDDCTFKVPLDTSGQSVCVVCEKDNATVYNVEWEDKFGGPIYWMGGASPDLDIGMNVIQFFSVMAGAQLRVIGAFSGIAS